MATIQVGPGELMDRLTILRIKADRITDPARRRNVRRELADLETAHAGLGWPAAVAAHAAELAAVNAELWDVEDALRRCEAAGDFGGRFVALARSVYTLNDRRAAVKRRIDETCGSTISEEKSYAVA